LHFFKRSIKDYTHVSDAGTRTLTFSDGKLQNQISYHSPADILIHQLTDIFQNIAMPLDFGHRLSYMRQQGNVGIDNELMRLQEMAQAGRLIELQEVCPVLQAIAPDPSVSTLTRQRAHKIVERAASDSGSDPPSHQ
jgi:hypothetical protein